MLENWCFEKVVLQRISKHHETQQPLPDSAIESIINRLVILRYGVKCVSYPHSRYLNVGLFYLRQVYIGL